MAPSDDLHSPFLFVPHGDPEPTEWMARNPGWVKFPATFVPHRRTGRRPDHPPPFRGGYGAPDPVGTFLRVNEMMERVGRGPVKTAPEAAAPPDERLVAARERAFLHLLRWEGNSTVKSDDERYRARFSGHDPMTDEEMRDYDPNAERWVHD